MRALYRDILDNSEPKYTIDNNVQLSNKLHSTQILIEVKACGLSVVNDKVLQMIYKGKSTSQFPVGQDIAGVVKSIGSNVCSVKEGDEVVGIIPLDYGISGCADYVTLSEYDVVLKPDNVSFVDAAGCVGDAVKVYTALHYLARLCSGDTVLIMDGASSLGSLAVQLCQHWGAKVITTVGSEDEMIFMNGMENEAALVIDTSKQKDSLRKNCMQETGGIGVDVIIDHGISMHTKKDTIDKNYSENRSMPTKYDLIGSLAVGGRWITSQANLQLDPPNSKLLYMKCASIGYLFEHAWMLSSSQQGRYQHILMDIMEKLSDGIFRPYIHHTIPFENVAEEMKKVPDVRVGKVVMTS